MKHWIARALCAVIIALSVPPTLAQETACIAEHVCVTYGQDTFAIDPVDGHYIEIVVEVRTIDIETLDGERTEGKVVLIPLTANGDTYDVGEPITENREGIYADADLRDVYVMTEAP